MKRTERLALIAMICSLPMTQVTAQVPDRSSSSGNDCSTFNTVMDDAYMHFFLYEGESVTYPWSDIPVPQYSLSLWGSTKGEIKEHPLGIGRILTLDYYYGDSGSQAKAELNSLVERVKACLPEDMYLDRMDEEDGDMTYYFYNVADKGEFLNSYPIILVRLNKLSTNYSVELQINSNAGGG